MSDYKGRQSLEDRKKEDDDDRGFFFWLWGRNRGLSSFAEVAIISTVFAIILAIILWAYPASEDVVATPEAPPAAAEPVAAAPAEEPQETVQTQNWGSSVIFPIEGRDAGQRRAAFDVAVLPTDLTWARKSSTIVTQGGAEIPAEETANRVFTQELRDGINQSSEVIAVGLASQEGQVEEETERARQRSLTAANWLSSTVPAEKAIWTLNLGQFKGGCKAAEGATGTSWQRPLIIVGIREQEEGVNITEAFADAISGKSNLPSRDCYTNFDLNKFR